MFLTIVISSKTCPSKTLKTIIFTVNQTVPEFCHHREDQCKHRCNFGALASRYTGSGTEAQALPHTLRVIKQMQKYRLSNIGQLHKSKQHHKNTRFSPPMLTIKIIPAHVHVLEQRFHLLQVRGL